MMEENNNFNENNQSAEPVVETPVEPVVEAPVEPVVEAPVEPVVETPVEPTVEAPVEPVVEPVQPVVEEPKVAEPQKEPKKGGKGIFILVAIVIIAAILGVTWVMLNKDTKDNKKGGEVKTNPKAAEYRILSNGLENFDLYFLKLENGKENKIYSPLSIKYTLEMLYAGAEGDSKTQIGDILGEYESKKYINTPNMSFANALFVKDSYASSISDSYKNKLSEEFGAEVVTDSFTTPNVLNNWVKSKTLNLIDSLVDDISSLDFILVNALGIDMEWEEKFVYDDWRNIGHETSASYAHRKRPGEEYYISWGVYADNVLRRATFEGVSEEISALTIHASANKYDIVGTLGEDNIKETVRNAYKEHLEGLDSSDYEYKNLFPNGRTELELAKVVDSYDYDTYMKEISEGYNEFAYSVDFSFYTDDEVRVFAKDLKEYDGTQLQYVGIMPITGSLDEYVTNVNAEKLNNYINNLKGLKLENFKEGYYTEIVGYIPKFTFDYSLDLQKDLESLGVIDVFDQGKANLSDISPDAYISTVEHKANIEFTQYGIKAAAATMAGGRGAGAPWDYLFEVPYEKIDLTFDRPYMFLIRDKATGEVWFTGTVYTPLLWTADTTKPH